MSNNDKHQEICYICQQPKDYYAHHYDLKINHTYGVLICNTCTYMSHDGWQTHHEKRLKEALEKNNLPEPKRNDNGLFPVA